jgi:hypothetical protein
MQQAAGDLISREQLYIVTYNYAALFTPTTLPARAQSGIGTQPKSFGTWGGVRFKFVAQPIDFLGNIHAYQYPKCACFYF